MKNTFKIIELEKYDVLIQKHWSQTDEEVEKHGDYQIRMSFWLEEDYIEIILGYKNEKFFIRDFDNIDEKEVKKLIVKILGKYE